MADLRVVVIAQAKIDKVIHRTPDTAAPVILIFESGVVAGDGGDDPLTPELRGIEQVLFDHGMRLLRRSRSGQHGVEIGWREARAELACVEIFVEKDARAGIPERGEFGAI